MAKVIFECDDASEARAFLDLMDQNGNVSVEEITPGVTTTPEARYEPAAGEAIDVHGMLWNDEIHASTKTQNADGSWKAKKGFAEQAKAAVAARKAAGGNQPAPAADTFQTATGIPAPTGMPAVRDMAPPITQDQLEEKLMGMMQRGVLSDAAYCAMLDKHGINRADPTPVTSTNESLRAALFASCCEIEPEVAGG